MSTLTVLIKNEVAFLGGVEMKNITADHYQLRWLLILLSCSADAEETIVAKPIELDLFLDGEDVRKFWKREEARNQTTNRNI